MDEVPVKVVDDEYLKVWHLKVNSFGLPQQVVTMNVESPLSHMTAKNQVMNKLLGYHLGYMVEDQFYQLKPLRYIYNIKVKTGLGGFSV